jgi:hypothetical protein
MPSHFDASLYDRPRISKPNEIDETMIAALIKIVRGDTERDVTRRYDNSVYSPDCHRVQGLFNGQFLRRTTSRHDFNYIAIIDESMRRHSLAGLLATTHVIRAASLVSLEYAYRRQAANFILHIESHFDASTPSLEYMTHHYEFRPYFGFSSITDTILDYHFR